MFLSTPFRIAYLVTNIEVAREVSEVDPNRWTKNGLVFAMG